jgi:hypothetical protein
VLGCSINVSAATLTVAWDPVDEPGVAGYFLTYGTEPGRVDVAVDVGQNTSWQIRDLPSGQQYYIRVAAYSAEGVGTYSNEVNGLSRDPAGPGIGPLSFEAPTPANVLGGLRLSWTVIDASGRPADYQFLRVPQATGVETVVQDYARTASYHWIPGPDEAGTYTITARARTPSSAGAAEATVTSTAFTINQPRSVTDGSRMQLTGVTDEGWSSLPTVAGRSYCAQITPSPTAVDRATPSIEAQRPGRSILGSGSGTDARACFVAAADERVILRVTQSDTGPRSYQMRLAETTLWADWFFIGGDYSSFTLLRNAHSTSVLTTITWRDTSGTVVGQVATSIPPGGVAYYDARMTTNGSALAGSVEIGHNGPPQAVVGSQTTLSAVTGQSFDAFLTQRRGW